MEGTINIPIRTNDINVWAEYALTQTKDGFDAQGYLFAPKKGDELMKLVIQQLETQAKNLGKPIRHRYVADNEASLALIQRTQGYAYVGKSEKGQPIYERIYR